MEENNKIINNDEAKNFEVNVNQIIKEDKFSQQATLFTRREWILRYASPFKALMFMAGPMIIITLVNALYGIIDKQLTLHFAMDQVISMVKSGEIKGWLADGITEINANTDNVYLELFAKQLINVSTQYSNTIIFILQALSLLTAVGTAVKWGQAMGRRNKQEMDSVLVTGLLQTLLMAVIGVIILYFVSPLIICAQANVAYGDRETSVAYLLASQYTSKFIMGFPLLVFATFLSTLLRTEGKVWWVIAINVASVAINMITGELIMKASPADQKMAGAVYGSMIAWGFLIIVALLIITFSKNTLLRPNLKKIKLTWKDSLSIWSLGFSPFLSNFIFAAANFILTLLITVMHPNPGPPSQAWAGWIIIVVNDHPAYVSTAIRVLSAGSPWMGILWAPIVGMMQGGNANYAYNKGSGNRFRILQTLRIQMLINTIWGFLVVFIVMAFGGMMLQLFDGPKEQHWWFFLYFSCFFMAGWTYSAMSLFQGTGQSTYATLLSVLRALISVITMTIIGWAIARGSWNNNGNADWIIFLFYGMAEIPAAIAATVLLYLTSKKAIKNYQLNNVKDEFTPPTLLESALNEVTIANEADISHVNKTIGIKIHALEVSEKSNKKDLIKELENKKNKLINSIIEKSRLKREKINIKYQFDDQISNDIFENSEIALTRKFNKHQIFLKKYKLDKTKIMEMLNKHQNKSKANLAKKHKKWHKDMEARQSNVLKPTPFNVLFSLTEPQPIKKYEQDIIDHKEVVIR
ncbi:MATE efflux family protein [Williamsoniiplasma somnilux]|uniref:MATE efflux family protein n=1 Tax=Williamsoniiplasma somnilux TaxID=215578 RepID=A0A2K8NY75_9MOLU|nr:MATE family efflux transporter [Williamsoniiplasma somnilux]ATZ18770.1 MATE efflux family protein [Williamsoniiplasma somnilux]